MKNIITQFANARTGFLNEPADPALVAKFKERFTNSEEVNEFLEIYHVFDGEKEWGALLPDWSIQSLSGTTEMMDALDDVWEGEDYEEEFKQIYPMRRFIPFITTELKTAIGPLINTNSKYNGYVIEFHYESATFIVWSKSLSTFINALFSFSIEKMPVMLSPDDENYPFLPKQESCYSHDFIEEDIEFLSKWPDIVFPVIKEPELYETELLNRNS